MKSEGICREEAPSIISEGMKNPRVMMTAHTMPLFHGILSFLYNAISPWHQVKRFIQDGCVSGKVIWKFWFDMR